MHRESIEHKAVDSKDPNFGGCSSSIKGQLLCRAEVAIRVLGTAIILALDPQEPVHDIPPSDMPVLKR